MERIRAMSIKHLEVIITSLFLLSDLLVGCSQQLQRSEPPYPNKVWGWEYHKEQSLDIVGDFVLKPGDSTDNGKIQVKVLELIPGDKTTDAGTLSYQTRAKLQFIRLLDNRILCENIFPEKGSITLSVPHCKHNLSEYGILSVYISAINLKDGWVHFQLIG
jgi:hypothetical protein